MSLTWQIDWHNKLILWQLFSSDTNITSCQIMYLDSYYFSWNESHRIDSIYHTCIRVIKVVTHYFSLAQWSLGRLCQIELKQLWYKIPWSKCSTSRLVHAMHEKTINFNKTVMSEKLFFISFLCPLTTPGLWNS